MGKKLEIAIESLLFGEYHIGVYENMWLILDKKYYVNSEPAAALVATKLQEQYPKAEIKWYGTDDEPIED